METILTILAILFGLFGWAFLLAGLFGMMDFDRKKGVGLAIADVFLIGGILKMLSDLAENWWHRLEQRRFIYVGLLCFALCGIAILITRKIDAERPDDGSYRTGMALSFEMPASLRLT